MDMFCFSAIYLETDIKERLWLDLVREPLLCLNHVCPIAFHLWSTRQSQFQAALLNRKVLVQNDTTQCKESRDKVVLKHIYIHTPPLPRGDTQIWSTSVNLPSDNVKWLEIARYLRSGGAGTMDFQRSVGRQSDAPERPGIRRVLLTSGDGYIIQGSISSLGFRGFSPPLWRMAELMFGWSNFYCRVQTFVWDVWHDFCKFGRQQKLCVQSPGGWFLKHVWF